jgi:NAD(P)-dependent dehydrogenase (short-subunit alcohol dehydrogenase family)
MHGVESTSRCDHRRVRRVGRATVRGLRRARRRHRLLARGVDGLEAARREVEAAGGRALVLPTDVADPDQVEAAAERVERELGPIDVWVNNAMVSVLSPVRHLKNDEIRRVTDVTYLGVVYGTTAALRRMLPRDRGIDSSRSDRPSPTAGFRCSPPTAARSTRFRASLSRCAASCCNDGSGVRGHPGQPCRR